MMLVVDDNEMLAQALVRGLVTRGWNPEVAGSVADGLAALEARPFRVVVTDYDLPDGVGTTVVARAVECGSMAIVMSGNVTGTVTEDARLAGARAVLQKPFDLAQLVEFLPAP